MIFKYAVVPYLLFFGCMFTLTYLWFDKILDFLYRKSLGRREEVIRKLDLMFVKIDPKKLTYAILGISFGVGIIIFLAFLPHVVASIVFGVFFTVIGWNLPPLVVDYLYEKRCDKFVTQMVDGMTVMANGVRSGLSVVQSIERVSANMSNPIKQEFRLVLSEITLGRNVEEALTDLAERIPRADVQMFVTSVNILKETGGNMAETFQTIMFTIRERQKLEKKIEALTAQGISQGIIISMVPFLLLVIFTVMDPSYVEPLFSKPLGWFALFLMLVLQALGGLMIRKIVKINV